MAGRCIYIFIYIYIYIFIYLFIYIHTFIHCWKPGMGGYQTHAVVQKNQNQKSNRETYVGRTCGLTFGSVWCPSSWWVAVGLVLGPTSSSCARFIL